MLSQEDIVQNILDNISNEVVLYDLNKKIIYLNETVEKDSIKRENYIGKTELEFSLLIGVNQKIAEKRSKKLDEVFEKKEKLIFEEKIKLSGETENIFLTQELIPIYKRSNEFIGVLRKTTDITQNRKIELEFEYMAFHDSLTGLPNRRFLYKELENYLNSDLIKKRFSIYLLDLDRFKAINDTLGHVVGDELIRSVAGRIINLISKNDYKAFVSRLGGDEFVIVIFDLVDEKLLEGFASQIINSFKNPFNLVNHELFITTSIGVYNFISEGKNEDLDSIIHKADVAMYNAKEFGRNKYRIFYEGMRTKTENVFVLETKMYRAYKKNEFFMVYQPKIDVKTKKIRSVESLLRWNNDGEIILPKDFLSGIEDTELFILIGKKILDFAYEAIYKLNLVSKSDIRVSINLSENQFFDEELLPNILDTSSKYNISPYLLEIEVNENIIMKNIRVSSDIINRLHNIGVRIAIDNFGSGSSSLGKLKNTPIDIINIDKSFIRNITDNYQDAAITGAIISMAQRLNVKVNAEGIENRDQLLFLNYLKCDYMQGYLFSYPMNYKEIEKLIISDPEFSNLFSEDEN
ncbi:MAG: EAL domain-containing protein [Leptospiraceae bacterium]|nr:EAL domain-containing protein [Leptospiraceae bacterium]